MKCGEMAQIVCGVSLRYEENNVETEVLHTVGT